MKTHIAFYLALLAALFILLPGCIDNPPADDDDTSVSDDDDTAGDDDSAAGDDDDSAVSGDDDSSPILGTSYAITSGGGDIASANHRARVVIGAPQPQGKTGAKGRTVTSGVDPGH